MAKKNIKESIGGGAPTNGAKLLIEDGLDYTVKVVIRGTTSIFFHRWNIESVEEKSNAPKGSAIKKKDNVESYVYRTHNGNLAIPAEYLRASIIMAAKSFKDPRSPRKSAYDLYKASVLVTPELYDLKTKDWDYLDQRRVVIQRNAVTKSRPAMREGWEAEFDITILSPEYISKKQLLDALIASGRLVGLGDFRPSYGRFQVIKFD